MISRNHITHCSRDRLMRLRSSIRMPSLRPFTYLPAVMHNASRTNIVRANPASAAVSDFPDATMTQPMAARARMKTSVTPPHGNRGLLASPMTSPRDKARLSLVARYSHTLYGCARPDARVEQDLG